MKELLRMPRNSIYTKLVLTILAAILPLYAVGLYLNDWSSHVVRDEISQSMMSKVHFYMSELETELTRILHMQNEFVNDDDLLKLVIGGHTMTDIEKTASILRFRDRLLLHKNSSIYIESASVYIPSLDRYITTGDVIYDKLPESKMEQLLQKRGMFTVTGDQLHLTLAYPAFAETPAFLLQTALSTEAFRRALSQFSYDLEGRAYLIDADLEWLIANQAGEAPYIDDVFRKTLEESEEKQHTEGIVYLVSDGEDIIASYKYSMLFDMYLIVYVPESQFLGLLGKFRDMYWILSLISLAVIVAVSCWIHRLIHRPLKKLVRAFRHIEMGNLDMTLEHPSRDEFNYLYRQFNRMITELKQLIRTVTDQRYLMQKAEFKQLQSQINPHFLYNSFFTLTQMVQNQDYEELEQFSMNLGKYFQFITRNGRDDVPLHVELDYAKTYIDIQSFRFLHRIEVEVASVPPECQELLVPRFIIQPIVENAYNHGLADILEGGLIRVHFEAESNMLTIIVEDNGKGVSEEELSRLRDRLKHAEEAEETTALVNVHRRLQLKYGSMGGIELNHSTLGGLEVRIQIPHHGVM